MFDIFGLTEEIDGIDHINVYSKGKTDLGRWLSNFAESPFEHPCHGHFQSVEGYWYWLKTGQRHDSLRLLSGCHAKRKGRSYSTIHCDDFKYYIEIALYSKVIQHPEWHEPIRNSTLPFTHYYVYGNNIKYVEGSEWIMDILEDIRYQLQNKKREA